MRFLSTYSSLLRSTNSGENRSPLMYSARQLDGQLIYNGKAQPWIRLTHTVLVWDGRDHRCRERLYEVISEEREILEPPSDHRGLFGQAGQIGLYISSALDLSSAGL